jgi:hypothetical protein
MKCTKFIAEGFYSTAKWFSNTIQQDQCGWNKSQDKIIPPLRNESKIGANIGILIGGVSIEVIVFGMGCETGLLERSKPEQSWLNASARCRKNPVSTLRQMLRSKSAGQRLPVLLFNIAENTEAKMKTICVLACDIVL